MVGMERGVRADRTPVVLRMGRRGLELVDAMAKAERVSRSEMLRLLVADGIRFRDRAGAALVTKDVVTRKPVVQAFDEWDALVPHTKVVVDAGDEVLPDEDWIA